MSGRFSRVPSSPSIATTTVPRLATPSAQTRASPKSENVLNGHRAFSSGPGMPHPEVPKYARYIPIPPFRSGRICYVAGVRLRGSMELVLCSASNAPRAASRKQPGCTSDDPDQDDVGVNARPARSRPGYLPACSRPARSWRRRVFVIMTISLMPVPRNSRALGGCCLIERIMSPIL